MKVNRAKLIDLMCEKQLGQKQLAEACGLEIKTVNSIVMGKRNPKIETVGKLAKCLECEPSELLEL